jgi:hypothetical protein
MLESGLETDIMFTTSPGRMRCGVRFHGDVLMTNVFLGVTQCWVEKSNRSFGS